MGANMSWSKATRFKAGIAALCFVMGKTLDRNPYH